MVLFALMALAAGCATDTGNPRLLEVNRSTITKQGPDDEHREEFYVAWGGANITRVKFEYRQVYRANEIFAKTYVPTKRHSNVFTVRGEEFRNGGKVSAWRVTLWQGDKLAAEQKSSLW